MRGHSATRSGTPGRRTGPRHFSRMKGKHWARSHQLLGGSNWSQEGEREGGGPACHCHSAGRSKLLSLGSQSVAPASFAGPGPLAADTFPAADHEELANRLWFMGGHSHDSRRQAAPPASLAPCYLQVGRRRGFLLEARSTRGRLRSCLSAWCPPWLVPKSIHGKKQHLLSHHESDGVKGTTEASLRDSVPFCCQVAEAAT